MARWADTAVYRSPDVGRYEDVKERRIRAFRLHLRDSRLGLVPTESGEYGGPERRTRVDGRKGEDRRA